MLTKKMSILNFESPVNSILMGARGSLTTSEDPMYHNYLEQPPQELYVHILSMLSLSDVGNLSLTGSTRIRTKIIDWIMSKSFQRKISVSLAVPVSSLTTGLTLVFTTLDVLGEQVADDGLHVAVSHPAAP